MEKTGKYNYAGEAFNVAFTDNGELRVSDAENTMQVRQGANGWYIAANGITGTVAERESVRDAVQLACAWLVRHRKKPPTPEEARSTMEAFVESLQHQEGTQ